MVEAVARSISIQTYGVETGFAGIEKPMELRADARAARSFAMRRGPGRQRHIATRHRWLQEEVARGRVRISQISSDSNPADLMTNHLAAAHVFEQVLFLNAMVEVRDSADARIGRGRGGCQNARANP